MSDDSGYSLVELLVAMIAGIVVFAAIMTLVQVTTAHQKFVSDRVAADQRGRPVLTNIIDELHSACVAPKVIPVLAGSDDSSMSLVTKTGSAVSPVPDVHVITLTGTTLSESVYPANGGTAPNWTFSNTASSTRELLTGVSAASVGSPAVDVPLFQYFAYLNGQLSTSRLQTPLSPADAARTVQVTVSFAASPNASGTATPDARAPVILSDSAVLRLAPASEDASQVNVPCS